MPKLCKLTDSSSSHFSTFSRHCTFSSDINDCIKLILVNAPTKYKKSEFYMYSFFTYSHCNITFNFTAIYTGITFCRIQYLQYFFIDLLCRSFSFLMMIE